MTCCSRMKPGSSKAGVLTVGLLALGYARHQAQAQQARAACDTAGAALEGTWTDDARAAIDRAIQKLPVKARFVTREEGF